jgi:ABC-type multidrug transport system ATPase subunit
LLTVKNLTKRYGKSTVIDNVSFNVNKGATVLMLGPNGAGKTTIIKCILGIVKFRGEVLVDGSSLSQGGKATRTKIGYVPQQFFMYDNLSVLKEAEFVASLRGASHDQTLDKLKLVGLYQYKDRKIKALSTGMRQKLALALALLNEPPLLIFDEPISSIDLRGRLEFQSLVREQAARGKTVLMATHISGLSEFADYSIVLDKGKLIAEGTPKELLARVSAKDTLFIKLRKEELPTMLALIKQLGIASDGVVKGEWLSLAVQADMKAKLIAELVEKNFNLDDILIEPSTIEARYDSLIGTQPTPS